MVGAIHWVYCSTSRCTAMAMLCSQATADATAYDNLELVGAGSWIERAVRLECSSGFVLDLGLLEREHVFTSTRGDCVGLALVQLQCCHLAVHAEISSRPMFSAIVYLNPGGKEKSTDWTNPILASITDRKDWEAILLTYIDAGEPLITLYIGHSRIADSSVSLVSS
jgi:hypothetical protein